MPDLATCSGITLGGGGGIGGIKTSEVNNYDGADTPHIPTDPSPTLNDVISAINTALGDLATPTSSGILWDGAASVECITFSGAVQTVDSVIVDLIAQICDNKLCCEANTDAIATLCATDIEICEEITTTCIGDEAITIASGTTLQAGLAYMLQLICDNYGLATLATTGVNSDIWDDFGTTDPTGLVTEWVGEGGNLDTGSGDLEPTINNPTGIDSVYIIKGVGHAVPSETVLLQPNKDNWIRFRGDTGVYIVDDVAIGAPEPPLGDLQINLWVATTNVISVTSSVDKRNLYNQDGTRWIDNAVISRHIKDLNVTGVKLEDFGTGAGTFDIGLGSLGLDAKGRVSSYASSVVIGALIDKQVLQYDAASGDWVNVDISTAGGLPAGTAQGQTISYNDSLSLWEASDVIRILGTTVSISSAPNPTSSGIEFNAAGQIAFEIALTSLDPPTPLATGTLPANTYFYIITSIDADGNESYISNEESQTIDGVTQTSISLSWTEVNGAESYRVYRGLDVLAENEYTNVGNVTEIIDDNTLVYGAGVLPTSSLSWKVLLSSFGLGYGKNPSLATPSIWYDVQGNISTMHDIEVAGTYGDSAPTITGIKSHVHADNPTGVNIAGWFRSLNEAVGGTSHVLRLEDGNDNTGKYLQVTDASGHIDFVASSATFALDTLWNGASQETETDAIDFKGDLISNFTVDGGGGIEVTFDATASNVGAGTGNVFKQKVSPAAPTPVDFQFKTLIGGAGVNVTDGVDDITIDVSGAIGVFTEDSVLSGHNIFGGTGAGDSLTSGATDSYHNFLAGINAGKFITDNTSYGNVAIGAKSGANLTTNTQKNTLIGNEVLEGDAGGVANTKRNVGVGNLIGEDWVNGGDDNIFIGTNVGEYLSGGSSNIFIGEAAQNPFATAAGIPLGTSATAADTDRKLLITSGLQLSGFTRHLLLGNMALSNNTSVPPTGSGTGVCNNYRLLINGGQCNPLGLKPQANLHVVSGSDGSVEPKIYDPFIVTQGFDMSDYSTDFSDEANRHDLFIIEDTGMVSINPKNVAGSSGGIDITANGTDDIRIQMHTDVGGSDHYYRQYFNDSGSFSSHATQEETTYTGSSVGNQRAFYLGTFGWIGGLLTPTKWLSAQITASSLGAITETVINIDSVGALGEINITSGILTLNGFTLPTGVGLLGQQLVSDGAGGVSWSAGVAQDQISYDMQEKDFGDTGAVVDIHSFIMVDTSLGSPMFFLPTGSAAYEGKKIYLKKMTADANTVGIRVSGGGLIDGAATHSLTSQWEVGEFIATWVGDATQWHRVDV